MKNGPVSYSSRPLQGCNLVHDVLTQMTLRRVFTYTVHLFHRLHCQICQIKAKLCVGDCKRTCAFKLARSLSRTSAVTEEPSNVLCQLKSCQLLHKRAQLLEKWNFNKLGTCLTRVELDDYGVMQVAGRNIMNSRRGWIIILLLFAR